VVVTGGARGIGRACAERFARDGARVAIIDIVSEAAEQAAAELDALSVTADVTEERSLAAARAVVRDRLGPPNVIVNNAGGGSARPTDELSTEEWDRVIALCLKSTFLVSRTFFPDLRDHERPAAIVNFSSVMGVTFAPGSAAYCSAKAGVIALTKVLAGEWAADGI
jgi:3-hydroxybutyrate dehydrogenase